MKVRGFLAVFLTLAASSAFAQTYSWDTSTLTVTEGDGPITVNLLRDGTSAQAKTVYISDSSSNADRNTNYVVSPLTVTFQPTDTSKAVQLTFPENGRYESTKNLNLNISSNSQVTVGTPATINVTINDNDLAAYIAFNFEGGPFDRAENAGPIPIAIRRTGDTNGTSQVWLTTQDWSPASDPISGEDYVAISQVVTFGPGETDKVVPLTIIDDNVYERPVSPIIINLNEPMAGQGTLNAALGDYYSAYAQIIENDPPPPPIVTLGSASYSIAETGTWLDVTIHVSGGSPATEMGVTITTGPPDNGSLAVATAATDYRVANEGVYVSANHSRTYSILIHDDTATETNEYFQVNLSNCVNCQFGTPNKATVEIVDNDGPPFVNFADTAYSIAENDPAGGVDVTIVRGAPTTGQCTVNIFTVGGTANSADFTSINQPVVFAPGETSKTVHVPIVNDTAVEGDQQFTVAIWRPQNCTIIEPSGATVTITDDDVGSSTFAFSQSRYFVSEGAGSVTVTLTRSGNVSSAASVQVRTVADSATADNNYTDKIETLNFAPGETSRPFVVQIRPNVRIEGPLEFIVRATLDQVIDTVVQIDDDDIVEFSAPRYIVGEGAGTVPVEVRRSGDTANRLQVLFSTAPGTATAGSDYTAPTPDNIEFVENEVSKTIHIPILQDSLVEGSEEFTVRLGAFPMLTAVVQIDDDDPGSTSSSFRLSSASYDVNESSSRVVVTVQRTGDTSGTDTVTLTTGGGTAEAGTDYATTSRSLEFGPGMTEEDVEIGILQNTNAEPLESFEVNLVGAEVSDTAVVIIADDDAPAPRTFEFASAGFALTMDLYEPPSSDRTAPVIVWIDSDDGEHEAIRQLDRGYAVVVVRTRAESHPEPLSDVVAAIRWLRDHDHELGLDTLRLVVWGKGAGGFLAAHAATAGWAQGAIVWAAPSDLAMFRGDSTCGTDSGMPVRILGCTPAQCPSEVAGANPAANASPFDPPFLIMHGEADCEVPVQQGRRLATALTNAGVDVTLRTYPGVSHDDGFWGSRAAMLEVEAFLEGVQATPVRRRSVR